MQSPACPVPTLDINELNLFYSRLQLVHRLRRSPAKRDQVAARLLFLIAKSDLVDHARRYALTAGDH